MTTTLERVSVALPLVLAAAATFAICRRRLVFVLGRHARLLAPVFCLALWLIGLLLAQAAGSLLMMSIGGALPLLLLAMLALRTPAIRLRPRPDLPIALALAAIGLYLFVVTGFDSVCHLAVMGNYLRGNIPPTALNDPSSPLVYHPLFDAAAAVFTRAFGADQELGLDLVSLLAVSACASAAAALSRRLFPAAPAAARLSVLCLMFGFGPTPLRRLWQSAAPLDELLRGHSNQAFLDQVLRRPYPLSFAIVCLLLVQLIELPRRPTRLRLLLLAPPFFLLPQVAEEQVLVLGALVAVLLMLRRLPLAAAASAGAAALAGGFYSGVLRALVEPASMATPRLALTWPPLVPTWLQPLAGWPIVSWGAMEVALLELGPIFLISMVLLGKCRSSPARLVAAVVAGNLLAACLLTLRNWPRADLDRFIFCASNLALISTPVLLQTQALRSRLRPFALAALALLLSAGSVPVAVQRIASETTPFRRIAPERPYAQLRRELGRVVAPRDLIVTDASSAQLLLAAGFLVVAPLDSHMVGVINPRRFPGYVAENACRARWRWSAEANPRARESSPQIFLGDYALLPNDGACAPARDAIVRPPSQ